MVFATVSALLVASDDKSVTKPKELTVDQQLVFQTALKNYYLRVAVRNNLRTQLVQAEQSMLDAKGEVFKSCPGTLEGIDNDQPVCKPTVQQPAAPADKEKK